MLVELIKKSKYLIILSFIIIFINAGNFLERIDSFSNIWTYGSGKGRIQLLEESSFMIKNNLLFGVGLNHFTDEMMRNNVSDARKYFLYPVHNTLVLFATEIGLLGFFAFIFFIIYVLRKYSIKYQKSEAQYFLIAALVFILNAQFHTLFNQDPSFDLFIVILAYMDAKT